MYISCEVNGLVFVVEAWIGGLVSGAAWSGLERWWETGEGWRDRAAAGDGVVGRGKRPQLFHEYSVISTPEVEKLRGKVRTIGGP